MANMDKAIEAAARALCRFEGNPENTRFEGRPMWQSYIPEATAAVKAALPHLGLDDEHPAVIDIPRMKLGPVEDD